MRSWDAQTGGSRVLLYLTHGTHTCDRYSNTVSSWHPSHPVLQLTHREGPRLSGCNRPGTHSPSSSATGLALAALQPLCRAQHSHPSPWLFGTQPMKSWNSFLSKKWISPMTQKRQDRFCPNLALSTDSLRIWLGWEWERRNVSL